MAFSKRSALWAGGMALAVGLAFSLPNGAAAQMKYQGAPMFADAVASGKLPPVEKRLPDEPLVQKVTDGIGSYGGTLRRGFLGPSDHNNYTRVVYDALVRHDLDGGRVVPHIAKKCASMGSGCVFKRSSCFVGIVYK